MVVQQCLPGTIMFRPQNIMPSRTPLFAAFVCALLFFSMPAHAAPPYAEILIDPATGAVLHAVNADATTQPASLTKMMTLFLAFDSLDKGELTLDQLVPVSRHAQNMAPSRLGLVAGTTVRVEDAILGLVTRSANDAAVALAEAVGGTEEQFAEMMTTKARILGMRNTSFHNASGLPNTRQITTARDIATLSQALIKVHARHFPYFSRTSFNYNGAPVQTHNRLMSRYDAHHCSRNRLGKVFISSCARKRGDIEFRRCLWRSAVGFHGIWNARPEGSNELGGQRVPGCVVRG